MSAGTVNARVNLRVEVGGEVQLSRRIQGRIKAVSDWSPAFRKIAYDFKEGEERQFAAQGAFGGNPAWAPLSVKYAIWKEAHFPGAKILTRTGRLMETMTNPQVTVQPLMLRISFKDYTVGRWFLPTLHQTGTTRGMPARKVINLTRAQRTRWTRYIRDLVFGEKD